MQTFNQETSTPSKSPEVATVDARWDTWTEEERLGLLQSFFGRSEGSSASLLA